MLIPDSARLVGVIAFSFAFAPANIATAQRISIDGHLSSAQTLMGPNYAIGAGLGRQVGGNLFHSFGVFGLNQGETATFSGPANVGNIIGRVTGGATSTIDGKIRSSIQGASVYLINPAGVVFGPHATVDVSGSFHASSADYLKMGDGARFQATNPNASTLTAAPPSAFGFLSATSGPVAINGSTIGPVGGRLALVGGPVTISNGVLLAPGGTVHVASAAGAGEVPVDPSGGPAPGATQFGPVKVNASRIAVSDRTGKGTGSVHIRGGKVSVAGSEIDADNFSSVRGGQIALQGDSSVEISQGSSVHAFALGGGRGADINVVAGAQGTVQVNAAAIEAASQAAGDAGAIAIAGGALLLQNGAFVHSGAQDRGAGGPINITAGSVLVDGAGTAVIADTAGLIQTNAQGLRVPAGAGGNIGISGNILTVQNGAKIITASAGDAQGGSINVAMSGGLAVVGTDGNPTSPSLSAISTLAEGAGQGGAIALRAAALTIADGATISSIAAGSAPGGAVTLDVFGNAIVTGTGPSFGVLQTTSNGSGRGGDISVQAGNLTIDNGIVRTSAFDRGDGGAVTINAGRVQLQRTGWLISETIGDGLIDAAANPVAAGAGGPITLNAANMAVQGNSLINSDTSGSGAGGAMRLNISADMLIDSLSSIATTSSGKGNGGPISLTAGSVTVSGDAVLASDAAYRGNGGSISIHTAALTQQTGGTVLSTTEGSGNGGPISIQAGSILVDGANGKAEVVTDTNGEGLTDAAGHPVPGGKSGTITITTTGDLSVLNGASLLAGTSGSGQGGNVNLAIGGNLMMDGRNAPTSTTILAVRSDISDTATTQLVRGNAGNVTATAQNITLLGDAAIRSNAQPDATQAAAVKVSAAGDVVLESLDSGRFASIEARAPSGGISGAVTVRGQNVTLHGEAGIGSNLREIAPSAQQSGAVTVSATGDLLLDAKEPGLRAAIESVSPQQGISGSVNVSAGSLRMLGSTAIQSGSVAGDATSSGPSGAVQVITQGDLLLQADGRGQEARIATGTSGTGFAARLDLQAGGNITLVGDAGIESTSFAGGEAGRINVIAAGGLTLDGGDIDASTFGKGSGGAVHAAAQRVRIDGGSISATTFGPGPGGSVTVDSAGDLSIYNGLVSARTTGDGAGGKLLVTAGGALQISGTPGSEPVGISAQSSGLTSRTSHAGDAGDVEVHAGRLTITGVGVIEATTFATGNAGVVHVEVPGAVVVDGGGPAYQPGGVVPLVGITSEADFLSSGNAGKVAVNAGTLTLLNGGAISSDAIGIGAGGSVDVNVKGALRVDGRGTPNLDTGIFARAAFRSARGGDVNVTAADIGLIGPSPQIATSSTGPGDAGSITITAPRISLSDGAAISTQGQTGNGGNITISARDMLWLQRSAITTSVNGALGNGGNIQIDPRFVVLDRSVIQANAIGGNGGNVNIVADEIVTSADSSITATSQKGLSGEIVLSGPRLDLNSSLVVLASTLRSAAALLRDSCAVRGDRPRSSLVVASPRGMREEARTSISALYIADRPLRERSRQTDASIAPATPVSLALSTPCG